MKVVRVQYTVRPAYAGKNQENIAAIVEELKTLNRPGIKYGAWILADGKTFMHFDQFESEQDHLYLQELSSFKAFGEQLWASGLEAEPKLEVLTLAASTEKYY